jgi:acyl transferase domain-containing protein
MTPILGKPLTSYIFVMPTTRKRSRGQRDLMQTAITQPAMLTLDTPSTPLLAEYGFAPDMVMGHSLGEYGALIAAGIMPFADALEAAAARGAEMTKGQAWTTTAGWPPSWPRYEVVEADAQGGGRLRRGRQHQQQHPGGGRRRQQGRRAGHRSCSEAGFQAMRIPVSHAFHTKIVAPASAPLRKVLDRLRISAAALPLVANVTGDIYPTTSRRSRTCSSCRSPRRCSG